MNHKSLIKGDEVRHGKYVVLDALSKTVIEAFSDTAFSESMLYQLNDGGAPISLTTPKQVAQAVKDGGGMPFALRLQADNSHIGACQLADVDNKSRHARLHISIFDEVHYTADMLVDVIQTVLQFAYWEANLNRIYVHCVMDNTHLLSALEQSGFTDEGHLRQEVFRDGHYLDIAIYSILRREWTG